MLDLKEYVRDENKAKELLNWPEFHKGVSAGLKLGPHDSNKSAYTSRYTCTHSFNAFYLIIQGIGLCIRNQRDPHLNMEASFLQWGFLANFTRFFLLIYTNI
jgi:hypothetical protein